MLASPVVFWILTLIIVLAALAVVLSKNIVHSALFLVLVFVGISGVYMLLEADFLAAVQLLVYAGAIAVLLVFGVMLTRRGDIGQSNLFNGYTMIAGIVSLGLFLLVESMTLKSNWQVAEPVPVEGSTVGPIANAMMTKYILPFEIAALLLLVAMVGAIILARGVKDHHG